MLIDRLQPHGGPASGGTLLTILGTGFRRRDAPRTEDGPLDMEMYESDEPRHDLQRSLMRPNPNPDPNPNPNPSPNLILTLTLPLTLTLTLTLTPLP